MFIALGVTVMTSRPSICLPGLSKIDAKSRRSDEAAQREAKVGVGFMSRDDDHSKVRNAGYGSPDKGKMRLSLAVP